MEEYMDQNRQAEEPHPDQDQQLEEPREVYTPRPAWQVWGARIALAVFILLVIMQICNIARGGL